MIQRGFQWLKWVTTADERALNAGQPWKSLVLGALIGGILLAFSMFLIELLVKRTAYTWVESCPLIFRSSVIGAVDGFYINLVKFPEKTSVSPESQRKWYTSFRKQIFEPLIYVTVLILPIAWGQKHKTPHDTVFIGPFMIGVVIGLWLVRLPKSKREKNHPLKTALILMK